MFMIPLNEYSPYIWAVGLGNARILKFQALADFRALGGSFLGRIRIFCNFSDKSQQLVYKTSAVHRDRGNYE